MSSWGRRRAALGWPIAGRLRTLVFLCWAMLLVVAFTAVSSLALQSANIRQLTRVNEPALDANNQVRQTMDTARTGLVEYRITGDRALLQQHAGAHGATTSALARLQRTLGQGDGAGGARDAAQENVLGERQRLAAEAWWTYAQAAQLATSRGGKANISQGPALYARFSAANSSLNTYLAARRDQTLVEAENISRGVVLSVGATLLALLGMLVVGGLVARSISRPLVELRDAMVRQREGDVEFRAREDQGSVELRSVAADFNALTDQNLALRQTQARALGTHQVTLQIARVIRAASDTQQALDVVCVALGEGIGVDRVIAQSMEVDHGVQLDAQWHRPGLSPLRELGLLPEAGGLAEELWLAAGFRARDDLLEPAAQPSELDRTFHRETGARAVIMVPIGLHDRLIGMIYVFMVDDAREWTTAETHVVQSVAGFVARAIVEAEHQANQREYVETIERLDRQKSDFLATVGHELRTPLTSISGYLELLQDGETGELTGQQQRMLEVISRNTVRLRSLIEDVMVLSRIEGAGSGSSFFAVSVHALITRVGEELSPLALASEVELVLEPGPGAAIVLGDWAALERAVVNILSNAIKFSRPGGIVTLSAAVDEGTGRVVVTCQDEGVGIPARDQADLFTRFFRASNATELAIPGTGLGLSIAKQIIEDHHGGTLRLTSVEEGGTTVILALPLHKTSPGEVASASQAHGAIGNLSNADGVFGIRA